MCVYFPKIYFSLLLFTDDTLTEDTSQNLLTESESITSMNESDPDVSNTLASSSKLDTEISDISTSESFHTTTDQCKTMSDDYVYKMIERTHFTEEHIHQYQLCKKKNQCTSLSSSEKQRLKSFKDKFSHTRISDKDIAFSKSAGIWWLVYAENSGMYCIICRTHNTYNKQNKSKTFNNEASLPFKTSAISDHATSKMHRSAIESELTSRVSVFHKEVL